MEKLARASLGHQYLNTVISSYPRFCGQNIIDIPDGVFYTSIQKIGSSYKLTCRVSEQLHGDNKIFGSRLRFCY